MLGVLGSCAIAVKQAEPFPPLVVLPPPLAPVQELIYREAGTAGWYGSEYGGGKTLLGEAFDRHRLSAVHRTLPLVTIVRVTELENYKNINAKINDRGPFLGRRFPELSYGVARDPGYAAQETAFVKIETMQEICSPARYTLKPLLNLEEEHAMRPKARHSKNFEPVFIDFPETNIALFFRVRSGSMHPRNLPSRWRTS